MNRLTHKFPAKVIAIFLFVISTIGLIGGVIGIVYLAEYNFYGSSVESAREEIFEDITRRYANIVFHEYFNFYQNDDPNSAELLQKYERDFSEGNTNFLFNIKNEKGEVVLNVIIPIRKFNSAELITLSTILRKNTGRKIKPETVLKHIQ